jgi:hypothetical protein
LLFGYFVSNVDKSGTASGYFFVSTSVCAR